MPTPLEFMMQYRNLRVDVVVEDHTKKMSLPGQHKVQLRKYFMMDWTPGTDERKRFDAVTAHSGKDAWFKANKDRIQTAAMGKGAPLDYELVLSWAVRSKQIPLVNQATLQAYCDKFLGIDCSGFATNYLCASGKKAYSTTLVANTSAASYFNAASAINNPGDVSRGDLLVWMTGNTVKTNPGHITVVESFVPQSVSGGNMRVVEATGASGANPKLLDSMYTVEQIIPKGGATPVMILVVERHGVSGSRVAVVRP